MQLESIVKLVSQALNLSADVVVLPLEGGAVNQVVRLIDGDRQFAVKWIGEDDFSGINRFHQYVLQEQLAHRGLAPLPVWLSDDGNLWVESWVEPKHLHLESAEEKIRALAHILASIHQQPITARPLQLTKRWRHYIERAQLSSAHPLVHKANELAEYHLVDCEDDNCLCLCHNDLSYGHILDDSMPIVVDWEYAAMGNRFFDLASCSLINEMCEQQSELLCADYAEFAGLSLEWVKSMFKRQLPVVQLTNQLWVCALNKSRTIRASDQVVP